MNNWLIDMNHIDQNVVKLIKKKKGCVTPLNSKAMSYNIQKYRETPSIPYQLARSFCSYAKKRGLEKKDFIYMDNCLQNGGYENLVFNKKSNKCIERNNYCRNINHISYIFKTHK